jgi:glycerol-3-phosphate responsive antiterminator
MYVETIIKIMNLEVTIVEVMPFLVPLLIKTVAKTVSKSVIKFVRKAVIPVIKAFKGTE